MEFVKEFCQYIVFLESEQHKHFVGLYQFTKSILKEKQKYGTFHKGSSEIEPVLDPKELDSLRKSIGLPHINYSAWRLKTKYGVSFD